MQCPRCEGSGKCTECLGSGKLECPSCDGEGQKATSRGVSYACKSCAGTGKIDCPTECSSCAGVGTITEQLQQETREKYRLKFVDSSPIGTVTLPLLAILVGVHVLVKLKPDVIGYLVLWEGSFPAGYFWAVLTPELVHFSTLHLLLNLSFLYYWGPIAEGLSGKSRYIALYLVTAIGATLASYLGNVVFGDSQLAGVGASGFAFGLIGYLVGLHRRWKIGSDDDNRRLTHLALFVFALGITLDALDLGWNLDNWGHLGGIVCGALFALILPKPKGH